MNGIKKIGSEKMKKTWILWWVANIFWGIAFVAGTAFVWLREVDGTGAVQTFEARIASFAVLLIAFIFPLIIQIGWLIINLVMNKNKKTEVHQL